MDHGKKQPVRGAIQVSYKGGAHGRTKRIDSETWSEDYRPNRSKSYGK